MALPGSQPGRAFQHEGFRSASIGRGRLLLFFRGEGSRAAMIAAEDVDPWPLLDLRQGRVMRHAAAAFGANRREDFFRFFLRHGFREMAFVKWLP